MPFQKFGRYEIERELGRGGMAVVFLARDPYVKRQVAVKVLPHQFTSDPQFRARFQREAEIIATLEHPHIVPIYDYGEQDEQLFLVMRYMPGGSLADCLRRGPLSTTEIARIVAPLASALDKAHARGIIHRDLKPGNILFDGDGEPYISDFGIAKLTQASTLLSGSALVGTPVYMSPEQWRGEKVDGRSDIYALGGMLYEMLSGRLPYEASTPAEVMFKCLMEPPPRLLETQPELDPALETVVARAMAKDRDERFATAGELATALETAIRLTPPLPIDANAALPALPEAVEAEVEELPPVTPPTVAATPPPTMPVAVAPEAVEAIAEPTPEAPPTVAARIEVAEAAPPEAPAVEAESLPAEAGESIQAEPAIEVVEAAPLVAPEAEATPAEAPEPAAEIAPMMQTPAVALPAQPAIQRAPRPLTWFALPVAAIVVIALLIVGGAVFGPGFFNPSAATPTEMSVAILGATSSPTRTISPTPTLTLTPTITPTRTPRPTATSISENDAGWVEPIVAFSEPILAAIADQKPDFQDDFSTRAGEWAVERPSCPEEYVDGEMVVSETAVSACPFSREMWYTDFVAEMDARFLAESRVDGDWNFVYRYLDHSANGSLGSFQFGYSGEVRVGIQGIDSTWEYTTLPNAARSGLSVNHVLVIVKDQAVALFVNDQPTYYSTLPPRWKNGGMMWDVAGIVAFDNFKIWDISNLPLAATSTPRPTATPTPKPTQSAASQPAWAADFAEPILAAIADQRPDFQDDFSTRAGGWTMVWSWCADGKYVEGEMVVSESVESECSFTREMWHTDFVAEMDARFVEASQLDGGQSEWRFQFRCEDFTCNNGSVYWLTFYFDGDAAVGFSEKRESTDNWAETMPQASRSGLNTNHVLVIAKGQEIALFVNGQSVFHSQDKSGWLNGGMGWSADGTVAFDNFKIWDISDLQLPATPTPRPTSTPTITPTRTPRPNVTPTAPPAWVTSFADPILAAIANQTPDFQDDFSTRAGGWTKADWCADWRLKYVDGEMVVSDCHVEREMWYTDFIVEMDVRFLPGSSPDSEMRFHYRRNTNPGGGAPYFIDLEYGGGVEIGFEEPGSPGEYTRIPDAARPGANVNNHVLVIVKDQAVALFVNDRPVYYGALPILWKNGGMEWSFGDTVAFDNFKVWDISDLSLTATPTPGPTATSTSAASPDSGTVKGRILWNDQPFAGVTVKLCTKWLYKCETTEYSAVSDAEGNYTIIGIPPGDYYFMTKTPDQKDETRWRDEVPPEPWVIKIIARQTVNMDDVHVWKHDLQLISPAHGATASSKTPALSWKAYPGAARYRIHLNCPGYPDTWQWVMTTTQWTVDAPLPTGVTCTWEMTASSESGQMLAESLGLRTFTVP